MARDAHAPRMEAWGAVQIRQVGDAGHDAITAPEYTTSEPLDTAHVPCRCAGGLSLLAGTLLDPHVSPVIACSECCLPLSLCCCGGR